LQCSGFTAQSATRSLRPCGIDRRRHPPRGRSVRPRPRNREDAPHCHPSPCRTGIL
jgi:hypothetical protein